MHNLNFTRKPSSRVAGSSSGTKLSVDDDTVYLEDIDPNAMTRESRPVAQQESKELSPKKPKNKWLDHDQYRLPDVDLNTTVANATRGSAPDPRLATEDELRAFIEEMRPEDFDYTSPAFRELPTEVQYEIIGDLRLKSRQTSYKRLETMLKQTKTPLDFSKQQILHLKQRNELTQQLLMTTDSIGKAHLTIPVRVASERNKQYVLIKNEGKDGGWILGMRDEGTMAQPIELDMNENGKDSDDEMDVVMWAFF
jgi:DNA excision repair protein ERCC-5